MNQDAVRGTDLEEQIRSACPNCARSERPRAARSPEGRLLWLHDAPSGEDAECAAAALQPRLALFRRRIRIGLASQAQLVATDELRARGDAEGGPAPVAVKSA